MIKPSTRFKPVDLQTGSQIGSLTGFKNTALHSFSRNETISLQMTFLEIVLQQCPSFSQKLSRNVSNFERLRDVSSGPKADHATIEFTVIMK